METIANASGDRKLLFFWLMILSFLVSVCLPLAFVFFSGWDPMRYPRLIMLFFVAVTSTPLLARFYVSKNNSGGVRRVIAIILVYFGYLFFLLSSVLLVYGAYALSHLKLTF